MFKFTLKLLLLLGLITVLIVIGVNSGVINVTGISSKNNSEQILILQKVEEIGNLELVRFNFNDVVEESIQRKFLNFDDLAPDSKVLLIINADAVACIDLKRIEEQDINISGDTLYITIPQPFLCYAKINHDKSKIYDANFTARVLNPELIDTGFKNAENNIKSEAIRLGILDQAKENAKKLLVPLFREISNKNIVINFDRDFFN